jgi:hypothetical protein
MTSEVEFGDLQQLSSSVWSLGNSILTQKVIFPAVLCVLPVLVVLSL